MKALIDLTKDELLSFLESENYNIYAKTAVCHMCNYKQVELQPGDFVCQKYIYICETCGRQLLKEL